MFAIDTRAIAHGKARVESAKAVSGSHRAQRMALI
jgi:hypothetical protein